MVLISKTKTLKDLEARLSIKSYCEWAKGYDEGLRDAIRVVKCQKHIGAEPVRHGVWVDFKDNDGYEYECSNRDCNCRISWDGANMDFRYCPNCGARMSEEES